MREGDEYRLLKAYEQRLLDFARRCAEMAEAKRSAVTFVRGADGVYRLPMAGKFG